MSSLISVISRSKTVINVSSFLLSLEFSITLLINDKTLSNAVLVNRINDLESDLILKMIKNNADVDNDKSESCLTAVYRESKYFINSQKAFR